MSYLTLGPDPFEDKSSRKGRKIDKNVRSLIWQKYNGNSLSGKCYVCKRPITNDNFEIGHNKAVARGGKDNISNLRAICGPCNRGMGTKTIEWYKGKYFTRKKTIKQAKRRSRKRHKEPELFSGFKI